MTLERSNRRITARRWTQLAVTSTRNSPDQSELEAENLYLREELDRARLALSGAHPAAAMLEAMQEGDTASDTADTAVAMYAQAMSVRSELIGLLGRLGAAVEAFESRLSDLTEPSKPAEAPNNAEPSPPPQPDHEDQVRAWRPPQQQAPVPPTSSPVSAPASTPAATTLLELESPIDSLHDLTDEVTELSVNVGAQ